MKNNNLKKTFVILLGLILPLSLTACNNGKTSSNSSFNSTTISSSTATSSSSSIIESSSSLSSPVVEDEIITIVEAIEIANQAGDIGTSEEYTIKGKIKDISSFEYGAMTIEDATGSLYIYGVYASDRQTVYSLMDDRPVVGDEITLEGKLKVYNGTPEMDRGYIVSFRHVDVDENIDLSQYSLKTISEARDANDGTKLQVKGTVAKITYADKMAPNGFYLIDGNASIYIYGSGVAQQVSIGNNITIAGEKSYYVLGTEQTFANKYGYKGSCQIDNAHLVDNDKKENNIDLSWCEETTVKDIMNTPVTENITTNIYKVNAVVNRVEGKGFLNYYFNDLDNYTGSYAYTQNGGDDFEYLKEFDGKICTVYLSPLNCKSTDTGCIYRFIPIQVTDDNYTFNLANAPQFALDYYVLDQFKNAYQADPAIEVLTSVSSELLDFEDVNISYTSSNTDVAYFENVDNKMIFHTSGTGDAKISITANYLTYSASSEIDVNVTSLGEIDYINVNSAIGTSDSEEVTVKGVVASSLVNKQGFYLVDESGLLAVEVNDSSMLNEVSIGDEVIVKGIKEHQIKDGGTNIGQNVLAQATLVANLYGNKEYSINSFEQVHYDELYDLASDVNTDYSAQGYRVSGKIRVDDFTYYVNYYLENEDGSKELLFYAGNWKSQYGPLLSEYNGQEVTLDVALCNWNSRKNYALCAIAVIDGNSKIINDCNWR